MQSGRNNTRSLLLVLLIVLVAISSAYGCHKAKTEVKTSSSGSTRYTDADLAESFVVTEFVGREVVRMKDSITLGSPPHSFYLTASNPDTDEKPLVFTSASRVELIISKADAVVYQYSTAFTGKELPKADVIRARDKKAFRLNWDGKLADGTYASGGGYSLTFSIKTQPEYKLEVKDISFKPPVASDEGEHEDDEDGGTDNGPSFTGHIIPPGSSGR